MIAPGVVAGLVPWWLTAWRAEAAYPAPVRITGAARSAPQAPRSSPRSRSLQYFGSHVSAIQDRQNL